MKHAIIKPNGETYVTVWREEGQLKIELRGISFGDSWHPVIHMDAKVIPQLISALQAIEKEEVNT